MCSSDLIEKHTLRRTDVAEVDRTVPRLIPVHWGITTVGQMPHNGWGLYDVIGNVREWTLDVFSEPLEANETDPVGPVRPSGTSIYTAKAIERGGSFSSQWTWDANGQWLQRSAARFGNERQFSANDIGFRIACPAVYVPPVE